MCSNEDQVAPAEHYVAPSAEATDQSHVKSLLSRATAFATVATVAGSLQQQLDRRAEHATSSNGELAERLVTAAITVESRVKSILSQARSRNRTRAAAKYLRREWPQRARLRHGRPS